MTKRAAQRVTLYTLPYCPDCRALKQQLEGHGIAYHEVNVAEVAGAVQTMLTLTGGKRSAPTVQIGSQVLIDPEPAALDALLRTVGLI